MRPWTIGSEMNRVYPRARFKTGPPYPVRRAARVLYLKNDLEKSYFRRKLDSKFSGLSLGIDSEYSNTFEPRATSSSSSNRVYAKTPVNNNTRPLSRNASFRKASMKSSTDLDERKDSAIPIVQTAAGARASMTAMKKFQGVVNKLKVVGKINSGAEITAEKQMSIGRRITKLNPALEEFKKECHEEKDVTPSARHFFGKDFFEDDSFPKWLQTRSDFQACCPRFCPSPTSFKQIVDRIPLHMLFEKVFRGSRLGADFGPVQISLLAKKAVIKDYPEGEMIYRVGHKTTAFYCVLNGMVSLQEPTLGHTSMVSGSKQAGGTSGWLAVRQTVSEGELFGEPQDKDNPEAVRSENAVTSTACRLAEIPVPVLSHLLWLQRNEGMMMLYEWLLNRDKVPFASYMTNHSLLKLSKIIISHAKLYEPGEHIYHKDSKAEVVYILRRGNVEARGPMHERRQTSINEELAFAYPTNGAGLDGFDFDPATDFVHSEDGSNKDEKTSSKAKSEVSTNRDEDDHAVVTIWEYKEGDTFGEEPMFSSDRSGWTRYSDVVASEGGAEVIAIPWAVADKLFPTSLKHSIKHAWDMRVKEMEETRTYKRNQARGDQVNRQLKRDVSGPKYRAKALEIDAVPLSRPGTRQQSYSEAVAEKAQEREKGLQQKYHELIGMPHVSVEGLAALKSREEAAWRQRRYEKMELSNVISSKGRRPKYTTKAATAPLPVIPDSTCGAEPSEVPSRKEQSGNVDNGGLFFSQYSSVISRGMSREGGARNRSQISHSQMESL